MTAPPAYKDPALRIMLAWLMQRYGDFAVINAALALRELQAAAGPRAVRSEAGS